MARKDSLVERLTDYYLSRKAYAFAPVPKEPPVGAPSAPEAVDPRVAASVPESADAPVSEEPAQSVESAS